MGLISKPLLVMFVIYDHPTDFPNNFVVRRWHLQMSEDGRRISVPSDECQLAESLSAARNLIPSKLTCIPRFDQDDSKIVEVWF